MKNFLISLFILGVLVRLKFLGINATGALMVGQLLLTGWLDERSSRRAADRDPYKIYRDENGVVRSYYEPS